MSNNPTKTHRTSPALGDPLNRPSAKVKHHLNAATQSTVHLKSGQVLTLRSATSNDAQQIIDYVIQVSAESAYLLFGPDEFGMTLEQEIEFLNRCTQHENEIFILGFIEGKLVTSLVLTSSQRSRRRHLGEFGMSVMKQYWGLGIGGAILDYLITWAKQNQTLLKLDLKVREDNAGAIALYRKRGFVEEGVLKNQVAYQGRLYDLIAMGMNV